MKLKLLTTLLFVVNILYAQTSNNEANKFIALFKSKMAKLKVGTVEEHYDQGYFKTLSESDYFDKGVEVGITTIYQMCLGKDEVAAKKEIDDYFEQSKNLKKQIKDIASKMSDFNFMKSYLKIRIYSDNLKPLYESHDGIVKKSFEGLIEVVVLDLPSGIGSLEKKYLGIWQKSEYDIYLLAKENTIDNINQKFEKEEVAKSGEEFYLLASDTNLFVTSSILSLRKTNPPIGKFGTLISIPNNTVIVALPLNDKEKINQFCFSFMGLTDHMYTSKETKPVTSNFFWLNGDKMMTIEKDLKSKS